MVTLLTGGGSKPLVNDGPRARGGQSSVRNLCRAAVLPEWNRRFTLSQWFPRPRPCSPTKAARAGFSFCLASCRNGASRNALKLAEQARSCDYDPCDEGGEAGEQQQIMQDDGHGKCPYAAPGARTNILTGILRRLLPHSKLRPTPLPQPPRPNLHAPLPNPPP